MPQSGNPGRVGDQLQRAARRIERPPEPEREHELERGDDQRGPLGRRLRARAAPARRRGAEARPGRGGSTARSRSSRGTRSSRVTGSRRAGSRARLRGRAPRTRPPGRSAAGCPASRGPRESLAVPFTAAPSISPWSTPFQSTDAGEPDQRPHDDRVVDLVHVVLPVEHPGQAGVRRRLAGGRDPPRQRRPVAQQRDRPRRPGRRRPPGGARSSRAAARRGRTAAAAAVTGSSHDSRAWWPPAKVGRLMTPPITERMPSTTQRPGHDPGRLVQVRRSSAPVRFSPRKVMAISRAM